VTVARRPRAEKALVTCSSAFDAEIVGVPFHSRLFGCAVVPVVTSHGLDAVWPASLCKPLHPHARRLLALRPSASGPRAADLSPNNR
jgi:hypothetical protein